MYDDFGNHIGIPPDKRTYERKQGCWNCVSADSGAMYRQRVQDCYQRDLKVFLEQGVRIGVASARANVTRAMLLDKAGIFILCLKGKAPGDFIGCKHLCLDGWSGRTGVTGGFAPGQAWDEPVAALYDAHGTKITTDGQLVEEAASVPTNDQKKAPST